MTKLPSWYKMTKLSFCMKFTCLCTTLHNCFGAKKRLLLSRETGVDIDGDKVTSKYHYNLNYKLNRQIIKTTLRLDLGSTIIHTRHYYFFFFYVLVIFLFSHFLCCSFSHIFWLVIYKINKNKNMNRNKK